MANTIIGSSKDVIINDVSGGSGIDLRFTERFSIFDIGALPYTIAEMGELRFKIALRMFEVLERAGIPTHFLRADAEQLTITVEPFNIYSPPAERGRHFEAARGRIIPLEIIDRQEVTQPLLDRAENNAELRRKMEARVPSWPPKVGQRFSEPLIECTTKYSPGADQRLSDAEAIALAKLGEGSYAEACQFVSNASRTLSSFFAAHGFNRLDGKWEVAITYQGPSFVAVDSYSPDEMRLIGQDGRSHDKDPLRQYYELHHGDWYKKLLAAKRAWPLDKSKWPKYPRHIPPSQVLDDLRDRYRAVASGIKAL